jgi:hypothetical protein
MARMGLNKCVLDATTCKHNAYTAQTLILSLPRYHPGPTFSCQQFMNFSIMSSLGELSHVFARLFQQGNRNTAKCLQAQQQIAHGQFPDKVILS